MFRPKIFFCLLSFLLCINNSFAVTNVPGNTYPTDAGASTSSNSQLLSPPCLTTTTVYEYAQGEEAPNAYNNGSGWGFGGNIDSNNGGSTNMAWSGPAPASINHGGVLCPGTYTVTYKMSTAASWCGASQCDWHANAMTDNLNNTIIGEQDQTPGNSGSTINPSSASGAFDTEATSGTTTNYLNPVNAYADKSNYMGVNYVYVTLTLVTRKN